METTVTLYSPGYREARTYIMAALFMTGNIILPQLCHTIPQGGLILLPIYFFTLIGAYKYGWTVGLLTALLSPIVNSVAFGMPPTAVLPQIVAKSVILSIAASYAAQRTRTVSLLALTAVVAVYQLFGSVTELIMTGSLTAALQDIRIGLPGLLIQVFGGYALMRYMMK